jgi:large subunit ribosomal protein L9
MQNNRATPKVEGNARQSRLPFDAKSAAEALYGSVTNLMWPRTRKGFEIEKRKIHMDDHIKQIGEFQIPIRLFKDVIAHVKLKVEAEPEG